VSSFFFLSIILTGTNERRASFFIEAESVMGVFVFVVAISGMLDQLELSN
jgi:hypothetical protein